MQLSTKGMTKDEWLQNRQIGSSDVPAILGFTPQWKTPLDVYNYMIADEPIPIEVTEPMEMGIELEPIVAKIWMRRTGMVCQNDFKIRVHKEYPFLTCSLDRTIIKQPQGVGVLECKAPGHWAFASHWQETDGPPIEVYSQIQHQLFVTEYEWGEIATIAGGQSFYNFPVEYDSQYLDLAKAELIDFRNNHLIPRIPPKPINAADVLKLYPSHYLGKIAEANEHLAETHAKLSEIKSKIKGLKKDLTPLEDTVKIFMEDAESLIYNGNVLATWKKSKDGTKFDTDTFALRHPELYPKFLKNKPGPRRFLIK